MMKVLTFTTLYPNNIWPNHGVFIQERMANFAKLNGCDVKVVAPIPYFPELKLGLRWKYSQVAKQEIREGLEVYHPRYFMTPKVGMSLYGLEIFLSVLPTVRRIRSNFDFDLIDAHYIYPDGFAGVLLGRFFRKPVVVSARGTDINLFPKFPLIRKLIQHTLNKSDRVIAVCEALRGAMTELGIQGEKIRVIPNGVDCKKFYPLQKHEAREKLGLPSNKRILLSVGWLTPRKGFDLLIKAIRILNEEFRQGSLHLVIAGEGGSRLELEKLISSLNLGKHVDLVGAVPHKELYLWYSAADVFCLASSREGWPNVIMESLACGTPVVATNVWGAPEIIGSNGIGFLTERTEEEIARNISTALKKEWNREEIIRYAREHTWDKVTLSVCDVFQSVLNSKPNNSITQ